MAREHKKIQLNLGCGVHLRKGFINIDKFFTLKDLKRKEGVFKKAIIERGAKFVQADIVKLPFKDNYADYIACTEMIEHLSFREVLPAFSEMKRVLKSKGILELTTVNFNWLARFWVQNVDSKPLNLNLYASIIQPIYGNQITEGEFHRCPFTPEFIKFCLEQTHFSKYTIDIYPANARYPKTKLWTPPKTTVCLTEMIFVRAIK